MGSIPGLGRSPGGGHGRGNSSILAWRIPWTEEPGGLQSITEEPGGLQSITEEPGGLQSITEEPGGLQSIVCKELDTSEVTDCSILLLNVKKSSIK